MRCYLQGTLDFACGVYAVINALSVTHGLDLAGARAIFREVHATLAANPALWADYAANNTDHYWIVQYTLERWCCAPPYRLRAYRPFDDGLWPKRARLATAARHLPECLPPWGPPSFAEAQREARRTWRACRDWLNGDASSPRALIMRFHRFVPDVREPIVSHWTTGRCVENDVLHLHDSSQEPRALRALSPDLLFPVDGRRPPARIVPESLLLVEKA